MAILKNCCFYWTSFRKGSYLCALHTMIYFGVTSVTMVMFLYSERRYLSGESEVPEQMSFIINSSITVMFHIALLFCSLLGVFSSLGLFIGVLTDCKELLVPWILTMIANCCAETSHFIYISIFVEMKFNVSTALIFTLDVFLQTVNFYCLLVVISQFQEYRQGRGRRKESFIDLHDLSLLPSTEVVTSPQNIAQASKVSSVDCCHLNCNLAIYSTENDIKNIDEIMMWNQDETSNE